ncbi:MAG: murein biosynthesis integral membrane protein MurJ [Gammaproteobacteria bacterium]|jgi:putative peptidoglycan lipid II flippase
MAKSLMRSTTLFSCNTFLSRVLGFVRDIIFAHYFGDSAAFDAFLVAFKIPNFMRRLFAEGAFSQAFVPVLSEYREQRSHQDVRNFINDMAGSLGAALLLVTIAAVLLAPLIISVFAPGFLHDVLRFSLATGMLRITFSYLLLISLTALCSAILNTYDSFGVPAFTPVLLNVVLIIMAVFVSAHFTTPEYALAWGVFIAGVVQLLFQLPFLKHKNLLPKPKINFRDPGVRRVLKLMAPAIFGVSVAQVSLLLDTVFASFLQTGSITWLYFSDRLMNFPLGVFGVAIATVVLPKLSRQHVGNNYTDYSKTLDWGLRLLLLIGIPSAVGILILAGPLLSTLFQGRAFDAFAVIMSRRSLMAFALGVQAFMLIKVLASGFYARQDIKTPVKIAVVAMIINMILNFILIFPLKHAGLALATTLTGFLNASLLLTILLRRKIYHPQPGWLLYFTRLVIANLAMAIFLFFVSGSLDVWLQQHLLWKIYHLAFLLIVGAAIYFIVLWISGLRLRHLRESG